MVKAADVETVKWTAQGGFPAAVLSGAGATHVGSVRTLNEDSVLLGPPVFVVADGIGGHSHGDVASGLVVEAFSALEGQTSICSADVVAAIARARVTVAGIEVVDEAEPGSTMVSAAYVIEAQRAYWLISHIGDSRAYLWADGVLEQITRDHSVVQELVDAGDLNADEAQHHPERNVITRAIGPGGNSDAEFSLVPVAGRQRLLLCSDGLSGEVSNRAIALILHNAASAAAAVRELVDAAINMGGRDNISVIVVDVLDTAAMPFEDTIPLQRSSS